MKTNKEFLENLSITNTNNFNFIEDLSNYLKSPFSLINSPKSNLNHEIKVEIINAFLDKVLSLKDKENTKKYLNRCLKFKDLRQFENNDFLKTLNKINNPNLIFKSIDKYQIFVSGGAYLQFDDNKYTISLGFSNNTFLYPVLFNNSLTPEYMESVNLLLKVVKGKVIILGLKLGYFAYMASLKEDVKEIFVVENNNDLINFFVDNVLPEIENKTKIHIINEDPLKYGIELKKMIITIFL